MYQTKMKTNELIFNRLAIFCCCIIFLTGVFVARATAQSSESGNLKNSIAKVTTFDGSAVIPYAGASLSRNNDGVFMSLYTSGLSEGTVVTMWWAIFNKPKGCATPHSCVVSDLFNPDVEASLQYAGGSVVGVERSANFGGFLARGDNTGFQILPRMPESRSRHNQCQ